MEYIYIFYSIYLFLPLLPMFRLRQALPFASGPANKARVAGLLFVFLGTGWITPFLAAKWTIEKNGRSNKWCGK